MLFIITCAVGVQNACQIIKISHQNYVVLVIQADIFAAFFVATIKASWDPKGKGPPLKASDHMWLMSNPPIKLSDEPTGRS